jgi:squalene-associated FAD-dependent desaturase
VTARHVVIIGGGLAGIAAAIELRDAGIAVTLLEARPWLGGATCSFGRGELTIDNGQHVFLRCCTAYRELLGRLGQAGSAPLQDRFEMTVLSPGGRATLRRDRLPGPFHLARALAGYSLLPAADRLRVGRAALALRRARPGAPELDRIALGDWLSARGQREQARRRLWDLFVISTLNVPGDRANTGLAAFVIKTALLGHRDAADIGVPAVPLGELHGQAAASLLRRLGADVRLGTKATAVEQDAAGRLVVRAVSAADRTDLPLPADGVILAVPSYAAPRLVPAAQVAAAARWAGLRTSPIVNVHVIYDRQVTGLPYAAAVGSPVQWVFDKTRQAGLRAGQYLAVSLSAADEYVDVPAARLRAAFLPAIEELFPAAAGARVSDFFVTRERRATFRQEPGCTALRPGAATSVPGFVLAGAWTDTGWPDTMEGAVRSGLNAAREVSRQLSGRTGLVAPGPAADDAGPGLPGPAPPPGPAAVAGADTPAGAAS